MDWITDKIAIGNYLDAKNVELISKEKIASILSLDGTLLGVAAKELGVKRIEVRKLQDNADNHPDTFLVAVRMLQKMVLDSPPVMVQCHAGRSRSVILVAAFFMISTGMTSEEAIAKVSTKREIGITPGLEKMLSFVG